MKKILGSVGYAAAVVMLVPALTLAASFFYVADDGSIGIGTSSPLHKLDVVGAIYSRLVTLSSSSTIAVNWNNGNVQTVTLSTSPTLTFSNGQAGGEYKLIVKQDSTGGRMVTWPDSIKWSGATEPILSSGSNKIDVISFLYDGSQYLGAYTVNYATSTGPLVVEYLVVGGGGGGGQAGPDGAGTGNAGGGGGAGGMLTGTTTVTVQTYSVTVGAGGQSDANGFNSSFATITASGGGKGGHNSNNSVASGNYGGAGGSGGGSSYLANLGGSGTSGQGNDGGDGQAANGAAAGGGGAGSAAASVTGNSTAGGAGLASSISGTSVYYAGGGGAGAGAPGTPGAGGTGGGGTGEDSGSSPIAGTANTGGGGGGGGGGNHSGAAGGSGIVIIRYPTTDASHYTCSGSTATSGSDTICTFTSNGTFAVSN